MSTMPERLARMEAILERLDHSINGNGQPGLAQKLTDHMLAEKNIGVMVMSVQGKIDGHIKWHRRAWGDWKWSITTLIAIAGMIVAIIFR